MSSEPGREGWKCLSFVVSTREGLTMGLEGDQAAHTAASLGSILCAVVLPRAGFDGCPLCHPQHGRHAPKTRAIWYASQASSVESFLH